MTTSLRSSIASIMIEILFLSNHQGMLSANAFPNNNAPAYTSSVVTPTINTKLYMISFGNNDNTNKPVVVELPRDVKEAVSKCRQATQDALQKRLSRIFAEFPVGTDFGIEKKTKLKGGGRRRRQDADADIDDNSGSGKRTPTQATLDRSDRELARLFVEMFQPVGGDNIAVAFVDDSLADVAKTKWKNDAGASCRVLAMNRRPGSTKKKKKKKVLTNSRGFAAKLEAEIGSNDDDNNGSGNNKGGIFQLPTTTEVALFVAPGPKELIVIEKICTSVGMGTLVVLLNARLDKVTKYGTTAAEELFTKEFEPVFSLGAASQESAPSCLLYRAYPGDWVLARKTNVGRPKTILSQTQKPTNSECQKSFEELEITDLEKNVEGVVDNVARWFT